MGWGLMPNDSVSVYVPEGVLPSPSWRLALNPLRPTWASMGPNTERQPEPSRSNACSVAVVAPGPSALTTIS